jgi:hypothetical protein
MGDEAEAVEEAVEAEDVVVSNEEVMELVEAAGEATQSAISLHSMESTSRMLLATSRAPSGMT